MVLARCIGLTYLFYEVDGETHRQREYRQESALTLCALCPVVLACRDWANDSEEPLLYGIAGGMLQADRRRALRKKGVRMGLPNLNRFEEEEVWRQDRSSNGRSAGSAANGRPKTNSKHSVTL